MRDAIRSRTSLKKLRSRLMERHDIQIWRKWDLIVNVLLIAAALFTLARVAW